MPKLRDRPPLALLPQATLAHRSPTTISSQPTKSRENTFPFGFGSLRKAIGGWATLLSKGNHHRCIIVKSHDSEVVSYLEAFFSLTFSWGLTARGCTNVLRVSRWDRVRLELSEVCESHVVLTSWLPDLVTIQSCGKRNFTIASHTYDRHSILAVTWSRFQCFANNAFTTIAASHSHAIATCMPFTASFQQSMEKWAVTL